MAIALNLSPLEVEAVAAESPHLFETWSEALRERWTSTDELLAGILELTHANYRVLLSIAGAKKGDIPKPYSVPRPGADKKTKTEKKKKIATSTEFAGWIQARRAS